MSLDQQEFLQMVAERSHLSPDEAANITRQVLTSLGNILDGSTMDAIQRELPPGLGNPLLSQSPETDELIDVQTFIGPLMNDLDTEYLYDHNLGGMDLVSVYLDQDAVQRVQSVFYALRRALSPMTQENLRRQLPAEIAVWWDDSGSPY